MAKREELETVLSAVDKASKIIDGVADKAEKLEAAKPEVTVDADDKASSQIDDILAKAKTLDGDTAEVYLKAEARNAKRDISAIQREIIDLDGEDATLLVEAKDEATARLNAVEKAMADLDSTVAEPKIESPDAESSGFSAGSLFSSGAAAGIGVGAIAMAIVESFNQGMERLQMESRFAAKFGLVEEEAKAAGEKASAIYSDGWGTGLEQVLDALGQVQQQLVATGQIADSQSDEVVTAALAIAEAFDKDVSEVIRSTGQLMKNGLAADSTEATDIIIDGLQRGADTAGDFFETIDEYSQHFDTLGLSAEQMNAIIIRGFQEGQRDADKLADAIKEMSIRTIDNSDSTNAAYESLGLNADEMREKILAGGDSAEEATVKILRGLYNQKDETVKNTAAVALIGTMYEDIGPKAIEILLAMADATGNTTGKTAELEDQLASTTSEWEMMKRGVGDFIGGEFERFAQGANDIIGAFAGIKGAAEELYGPPLDDLASGLRWLTGNNDELTGSLARTVTNLDDAGDSANSFEQRVAEAAEGTTQSAEEVAASAEQWAGLQTTMDEAAAEAVANYDEMVEAATTWADGIGESIDRGTQSFYNLDVTAETTAANFADQLAMRNAAASAHEENLATVFSAVESSLVASGDITAEQAANFAGYLADMGESGQGLVADMASSPDEVDAIVQEWVKSTELGSDGMIGGLDPTAQGMADKIAAAETAMNNQLRIARVNAVIEATIMGSAIPQGVGSGIANGQGALNAQIRSMMSSALAAARAEAQIESPSKKFAKEVGEPIAQGVAQGIDDEGDSISNALTRQLESGADAAVDAAHDLVAGVRDVLDGLWDEIATGRSEEGMREAIGDAADGVAEAEGKLAEAKESAAAAPDEFGRDSDEYREAQEAIRDALDRLTDAEGRLEDANYRLAQATFETSMADEELRDSWVKTAEAAGLTGQQIAGLIAQYDALTEAKKRAAIEETAIREEQGRVQGKIDAAAGVRSADEAVRDAFEAAVKGGVVTDAEEKRIDALTGGAQVAAMKDRLNKIAVFFGDKPKYHAGGVYKAPTAGGQGLAMLRDGERVSTPTEPAVADLDALKRSVSDGMVDGWRRIQQQMRTA